MRIVIYLLFLAACFGWYIALGQWLGWVMLLWLLCLPVFSLLLSLPAIRVFCAEPEGPRRGHPGQKLTYLIVGRCAKPMPPFHGQLCLEELSTGQSISYDVQRGFVPAHCGGYRLMLKSARVMDYLGLVSFPIRKTQPITVLIAPIPVPVQNLPHWADTPTRFFPAPGQPADSYDLRSYRPGDSLRAIHWKLSLKTGSPILRAPLKRPKEKVSLTLSLCGSPEQVDEILGKLLWVGQTLLDAGLTLEILAGTGMGTLSFLVETPGELLSALDTLLCQKRAIVPSHPEPPAAGWHYAITGGEQDEA